MRPSPASSKDAPSVEPKKARETPDGLTVPAARDDAAMSAELQAAATIVGADLASAMTHPLRIRIVVVLNTRVMSPSGFTRRFRSEVAELKGARRRGESERQYNRALLSYVANHFRRLEELGCIELVDEKTGGKRRGSRERFYRAVQRTLFDASGWLAVPASKKGAVTATAFSTYIEHVAEAMRDGVIDARDERHLTWMAMHYDEQGWTEMREATDSVFLRSLELRIEAAQRLATSGEAAIPVTVGLAFFESPPAPGADPMRDAHVPTAASPAPAESRVVSERLAKAMTHPLRVRILVELNKRPMSPTQFTWEIGGPSLPTVAAHFRRLRDLGCIELVDEKTGGRRRGGREHFYRAVQRSLFDESVWSLLPASVRAEVTAATFTSYIDRVAEAIEAETMDVRPDRHFTWTAMHYDQQAWDAIIALTFDLFRRAFEIQAESLERLKVSGESAIPVTASIACFESSRNAQLSPIPRLEEFLQAMKSGG